MRFPLKERTGTSTGIQGELQQRDITIYFCPWTDSVIVTDVAQRPNGSILYIYTVLDSVCGDTSNKVDHQSTVYTVLFYGFIHVSPATGCSLFSYLCLDD